MLGRSRSFVGLSVEKTSENGRNKDAGREMGMFTGLVVMGLPEIDLPPSREGANC